MKNEEQENKAKSAVSAHYDPENPQNQNLPAYNSTTTHREAAELPAIENLNHPDGLKDEHEQVKNKDSDNIMTSNDDSLHGKNTKTDLGAGQRDADEDEKEKIITP